MVSYTSKAVNDAIIETAKQAKENGKNDSKRWKISTFLAVGGMAISIILYFLK